jgi:nucleoside-diphosphate-sugar epimerase
MNILVTGGSGFFGIYLTKRLLAEGNKIRNADISPAGDADLESSAEYLNADVRDYAAIEAAVRGADVVFHNAAVLPVSRSKRKAFWRVNVYGTRNVLEASLANGVNKVIFISSSAPYGIPEEVPITEKTSFNPVGDYGRSKIEAERLCVEYRSKGLDTIILRPRTIVDEGRLGIFQILFSWIADNRNIYIIGKGDNLFQLLSASDLADACALCVRGGLKNEDFNIGSGGYGTVREDLENLIRYAGSKSKIVSLRPGLAKGFLRLLDGLNLSPLVSWHYMTPDKPFYFDNAKAANILGFVPKDDNGKMLKRSYDWYKANRKKADSELGVTHRKSARQRILKVLKEFS